MAARALEPDRQDEGGIIKAYLSAYATRYEHSCPNYHCWNGYEMDIRGLRPSGFLDEIEVKKTRSDFLADFRKTCWAVVQPEQQDPKYPRWDRKLQVQDKKHDLMAKGWLPPNYFAFLMPASLAETCRNDIPDHAGLYAWEPGVWRGNVTELIKPPRLHNRKISEQAKAKMLAKMARRYWFAYMGVPETDEAAA